MLLNHLDANLTVLNYVCGHTLKARRFAVTVHHTVVSWTHIASSVIGQLLGKIGNFPIPAHSASNANVVLPQIDIITTLIILDLQLTQQAFLSKM